MNVFLHGWSFSKDIWKDFFYLDDSLFLDLPFHGSFKNFKKENIINSYVNYLTDKIKEPSNFIGWSLGASVAVKFAVNYPQKVKKLILIGFSPKFKDEKLGHNPKFIKAFMISLRKDFEKTVHSFRKLSSDNEFKEIPLPGKEGAVNILNEFINLDLIEDLKELNQEVVFIHGKEDKVVNYEASVFSKKQVKNSKLILLDDNHSPFISRPDIIVNQL